MQNDEWYFSRINAIAQNRTLRIPLSGREENLKAIAAVINNDELMKGPNNAIPILIQDIRDIVNNIEPANVNHICDAITSIQEIIHNSPENGVTDNIKDTIDAFIHINPLSLEQIRFKLEENSFMKEIIDTVKVGMDLN